VARNNGRIDVVVTGCGLVSSLGLDVVNSCAAARAGVVRATSMEVYPVKSSADGSVSGAVCHAVPFLTEGFEGEARLTRLMQGGLEDLVKQCPDTPWKTKSTAFYLSLPGAHRLLSGAELVADENIRKKMLEAANGVCGCTADVGRASRLLNQGAEWAGWHGKPNLRWCTESDNTGVAEAIRQASSDLAAGVCDLAIVGGVESLLDEDTLFWLEVTGRLKTPDQACGLQPGEACGFLILENAYSASNRSAGILSRIDAICFAEETKPVFSGELSTGVALAQVVHDAAQSNTNWESSPIWLIHDLNGESYRANEWGNALFRIASRSAAVAEANVWLPAVSFGSTGAATGAVQACVAIHAFQRGNSPQPAVGMIAASDDSMRACEILTLI
jgi:hypothetical protein